MFKAIRSLDLGMCCRMLFSRAMPPGAFDAVIGSPLGMRCMR